MKSPVVVASMGRAGSSILFLAIEGSKKGEGFRSDLSDCEYEINGVYKTHAYPPEDYSNNPKFIWTFSDPYEIVISVLRQKKRASLDWIKGHFENMGGVSYENCENLFQEDCLALEEQFEEWHKRQSFPLVTVKYRAIWRNKGKIEEFLQRTVDLPPFSPRKKRFLELKEKRKKQVRNTYKDLHRKWKGAPNFKEWSLKG